MKITPFIIEQFGVWLAGGLPFKRMKEIVTVLDDRAIIGAEKKRMAILEFKEFGYEFAEWLVDTLVQLAVAWLRMKQR